MFKLKYQSIGVFIGIMIAQYSEAGAEESFKSSKFLEYTPQAQASYISTSIAMAGLVAARNDKTHADCIDRWYFTDMKKGNRTIIKTMRQYPDYHPQAVILALLKKACGPFNYTQK